VIYVIYLSVYPYFSYGTYSQAYPPLFYSTFLGFALVGPVLHYWYGFLARKFAKDTLLNVLKRLALDQLVFTPVFITVFMSSVLALDGRPENVRIASAICKYYDILSLIRDVLCYHFLISLYYTILYYTIDPS
jgi:hypothetical protein